MALMRDSCWNGRWKMSVIRHCRFDDTLRADQDLGMNKPTALPLRSTRKPSPRCRPWLDMDPSVYPTDFASNEPRRVAHSRTLRPSGAVESAYAGGAPVLISADPRGGARGLGAPVMRYCCLSIRK